MAHEHLENGSVADDRLSRLLLPIFIVVVLVLGSLFALGFGVHAPQSTEVPPVSSAATP